MAVTLLNNGNPFPIANDWVITATLTRDGSAIDLTGATVTVSVKHKGRIVITSHAVVLTDASNGVTDTTILDSENSGLSEGLHEADFKIVHSGNEVENSDLIHFNTRRPITL